MGKYITERVLKLIASVGNYAIFLYHTFRSSTEFDTYRKNVITQMLLIGYESLPVVILSAVFTGVVITVQTAYMLASVILGSTTIGAVVVPSLMLELSVLITALVMASRVGASIAAEVGNMKVTDQVDALEAMGLNAMAYLAIPRVLAGILMFPVLYVVALAVGIISGAYAGQFLGYISVQGFIDSARVWFLPFDPFFGVTKSLMFGFIITSIACWKGFSTEGGAEGVGRTTTEAVVTSCVIVLFADYVLAELLL